MKIVDNRKGTRFVKLTYSEVRAIVETASSIMRASKINGVAYLTATMIISGLIKEVDFVTDLLDELQSVCNRTGIVLPAKLATPSGAREQYRGLNEDQRHVLRRYRHAQIIRDVAGQIGVGVDDIATLSQIPALPTPEIENLIRITREANATKVKNQRLQHRTDVEVATKAVDADTIRSRVNRGVQIEQLTRKLAKAQKENTTLREYFNDYKTLYETAQYAAAEIERLETELEQARATITEMKAERFELLGRVADLTRDDERNRRVDLGPPPNHLDRDNLSRTRT